MDDRDIRTALDRHWAASQAGDDDAEDEIYHDDVVLEYPQSGERIRGRVAIRTTRDLLPNKQFTIRRVLGRGDLWVQGREGLSRDAVLRRPLRALVGARPMGRAD